MCMSIHKSMNKYVKIFVSVFKFVCIRVCVCCCVCVCVCLCVCWGMFIMSDSELVTLLVGWAIYYMQIDLYMEDSMILLFLFSSCLFVLFCFGLIAGCFSFCHKYNGIISLKTWLFFLTCNLINCQRKIKFVFSLQKLGGW